MKLYANGKIIDDSNPLPVIVVGSGEGGSGGMRFLFGTADPQPTDGEPGDVYLNTVSGDLFKNENGTWNLKGNLRGPEGPEGPEGPQGPQGLPGVDGKDGRGVVNIVYDSDANELVFVMSDSNEIRLPWPTPKE